MSWNRLSNSYLSPGYSHRSRPPRTRSSSASFTDTMSNAMQRELSQSSHVTESSQTPSSIHSNIGTSITSFPPPNLSYIQNESEAFYWSRPHIAVEDHSTFTSVDHRLLPLEAPLPQPTPDVNDPLLNIEANIPDPSALLELIIDRLRQEFATHPNQTTYALSLAQTHLGTDAIRRLIAPRVVLPRSPLPPSTPSAISPIHRGNSTSQRDAYLCKLCPSAVRITSRGAFKRHVNEKHEAKSMFLCMHCEWTSTRKDKLRDHLKARHYREYDREQDLTERELVMAEPSKCVLCETDTWMNHIPPFPSWDIWFAGIADHCRIDENPEDEPKKEPDTPTDQGDGDAGGNSGFLFPNLTFTPGSSAGSASLFQGPLASDSVFTGWRVNSLTQQAEDDEKKIRKPSAAKTWSNKNSFDLSDISKELCELSSNDHPSRSKPSSSRIESIEVTQQWAPKDIMFISNIIQELDVVTLVFSINRISLRLNEKLQGTKSEDNARVTIDPLILGEKTLYRIHYDHSISHQILARHLRRCHNSLNAIQWELSSPSMVPAAATTTGQQVRRRKRLSSLWARLRAVSFVLSLQKEVAVNDNHVSSSPHPSNIKKQLASSKPGRPGSTTSSFTSEALGSLYNLAQKHLSIDFGDDTYDDPKKDNLKSYYSRSPSVNSPLGIFSFLQSLTAVISNPQPSLMESYDMTDLYGLLHRSITNISTTSF
ncbi:hypothetical protein TMatcc_009631 [Talaromyces marneffei ATCC 18224]|uniref:Zinc finger protein MSN4 n=1 Tax=Talaromyces marneffei PM1 TaxID=1077442 RepID=A0A093VSJ3_TALMA|nr:hypothetical protein EYB25_009605 [Talaromyces marneffei]